MGSSLYNRIVVCEIFSSKPALFYDDNNTYLDKIASFTSKDFDITLTSSGKGVAGSVALPMNFGSTRPIKIGDVVNLSIVNVRPRAWGQNLLSSEPMYFSDNYEYIQNINPFMRAFVITSVDQNRLVLMDYNEYNHSFVTVGYVGTVNNVSFGDLIARVCARDMRAFVSNLYGSSPQVPILMSRDTKTTMVNFVGKFESTNVKPFEVLTQAIDSIEEQTGKRLYWSSLVYRDYYGRYAVKSYIYDFSVSDKLGSGVRSIMTKAGADVGYTPHKNTSAATIWIQPEENSDNYVRCGVIIATTRYDGSTQYQVIGKISQFDYNGFAINEIPSILLSHSDIFALDDADVPYYGSRTTMTRKAPDKTAYSNTYDYQRDKESYDQERQQVQDDNKAFNDAKEAVIKAMKDAVGDISKTGKELIADITYVPSARQVNSDAYNRVITNITKKLEASVKPQYTNATLTISETQFLGDVVLRLGTTYNLYHNTTFGVSLRGDRVAVTAIQYTRNSTTYTLKTVPPRIISSENIRLTPV